MTKSLDSFMMWSIYNLANVFKISVEVKDFLPSREQFHLSGHVHGGISGLPQNPNKIFTFAHRYHVQI